MDLTRARTVVAGVALAVVASLGWPTPAGAADAAARCAALAGLDIPARVVGLPTTGGEVTGTALVAPSGSGVTAIGEYCRVDAALHPVDPAAPDIRMQVALPTTWNQKALMFGGGGYDGTIPALDGNVPFGPDDAPKPLGRGYATFASDSGHQAPAGFLPATSLYGEFLADDEALHNFAGDALKKTRDAAGFVIGRYYDRNTPRQTYFAGGSTGGREALAVAQRWARDIDGVIIVYPAFNAATLDL
jgi:hypothetical protein